MRNGYSTHVMQKYTSHVGEQRKPLYCPGTIRSLCKASAICHFKSLHWPVLNSSYHDIRPGRIARRLPGILASMNINLEIYEGAMSRIRARLS